MDIYLNYKRSLDNIAYPNNNIQLTATPAPPHPPKKKFFLPPDDMTLSDPRGYTII